MDKHLQLAESLAHIMDSRFSLFGIKFGVDPFLDLIPGLGDVVGLLVSLYIVWIASRFELSEGKMTQIFLNIIIDFLIGLIPIVGIVGDLFYRANLKNIAIIKGHREKRDEEALT